MASEPKTAISNPSNLDISAVSPALQQFADKRLFAEVWKRPGLSERDRSIVTFSALVARNQTLQMGDYIGLALDSGVKPTEISELIHQLAFYSGWENAMGAVKCATEVFKKRGITSAELPSAKVESLNLDEVAEEKRKNNVDQNFGAFSQESSSTRPMCCFVTCGCGQALHHAIKALSP